MLKYILFILSFIILNSYALYYPSNPNIPSMNQIKYNYKLPFDLIDLKIETKDHEFIHLYYGIHLNSSQLLLLFQSNAGCFLDRLFLLKSFYSKFNISVGILSYRGYGNSTGKPSEQGFIEDALASLSYLNKEGIPIQNIIIIGRSIGVGVALSITQILPIKKLILENGFTSLIEFLPSLQNNEVMIRDPWLNEQKIETINKNTSILFLLSEEDEIVPTWMTRKMEKKARDLGIQTKLVSFPGAKHMQLPYYDNYYRVIKEFLNEQKQRGLSK
ncbi:protein bem46, putative [Entamoeba dispar SAW760]|uniref:Protein bem46, putative n=1 Tax=Entamoeba dispar (strain ATCC PRA-260 / SAW760) TaxID=370354 RepID=B0EU14_ENTDS|nr:protein bem46, putative [Entamoeba dispar SAW760]EDR21983.1 protein bem46, putative [Entamoeba dispar SAW760]|eukprot:EDR21983.1 protein bem46, putative [Entamoeba dispar SAW760]